MSHAYRQQVDHSTVKIGLFIYFIYCKIKHPAFFHLLPREYRESLGLCWHSNTVGNFLHRSWGILLVLFAEKSKARVRSIRVRKIMYPVNESLLGKDLRMKCPLNICLFYSSEKKDNQLWTLFLQLLMAE